MTHDVPFIADELAGYMMEHSSPPDDVQQRLIETTRRELGDTAAMQIGPVQGAFMTILTAALRPRLAIEIGTFTGYSALAVARALPAGGKLICCDVSTEWTDIGRAAWEEAGVADRVDLRIGPAIETLRTLPHDQVIDLAFIDADKPGYVDYFDELVERLAPTGLILVDNVLWGGSIVDDSDRSESTIALREFNHHVRSDERVRVALLAIGDGLSVIGRADADA